MDLTPTQISTLEKLLRAGFKFVTIEHVERYLGVEKSGFVALLDPSQGELRVFGQVGYRIGEGIGMLVDRAGGKAFVRHQQSVAVTPELVGAYEAFKVELGELLGRQRVVG